jgi:hypothetical protein
MGNVRLCGHTPDASILGARPLLPLGGGLHRDGAEQPKHHHTAVRLWASFLLAIHLYLEPLAAPDQEKRRQ